MVMGLPNPEKGYCPTCKAQQLFVPVYAKHGDSESLSWKCTKCGHKIEFNP